jgi:hypothetical protein
MATAKEISDTARVRAMSAYKDWLEGGRSPKELQARYGVGHARMWQLIQKGERLSTPTRHWSYGTLTDNEAKELAPCKDWLIVLTKGW